jgi:hypothetical protein
MSEELVIPEDLRRTKELFGVEPYALEDALVHACVILDVVKNEWAEAWGAHDQRVRAGLSLALLRRRTVKSSEEVESRSLANAILDRNSADPDDDLAVLSRQLLRADERISRLESALATAKKGLKE